MAGPMLGLPVQVVGLLTVPPRCTEGSHRPGGLGWVAGLLRSQVGVAEVTQASRSATREPPPAERRLPLLHGLQGSLFCT